MIELEKIILVATDDRVETYLLADEKGANSQMLKNVCDRMQKGSLVAFDRNYYKPYRLFDFVGDVNNKFPDLIDLEDVYNHVEKYWEWHYETYKVNEKKLAKKLGKEWE